MTIKAFAEKYKVTYYLAKEAASSVTPVATLERDVDYPEKEMRSALLQVLAKRRNKAKVDAHYYDKKIMYVLEIKV